MDENQNETEENVWETPDPIKVVALEQAVNLFATCNKLDEIGITTVAAVFENYLRESQA